MKSSSEQVNLLLALKRDLQVHFMHCRIIFINNYLRNSFKLLFFTENMYSLLLNNIEILQHVSFINNKENKKSVLSCKTRLSTTWKVENERNSSTFYIQHD